MHLKDDTRLWYLFSSLFFALLVIAATWLIAVVRGSFPRAVPPADAFILALAAFRLTRLLVYDSIARPFRELFEDEESSVADRPSFPAFSLSPGLRATIRDLLECPWCVGIWSALVVAFAYFISTAAWFVLLVLALAGASSLLQLVANWTGWEAEVVKRAIQRTPEK